ncbi:hypothetical protein AYI68_g115 [Smittium mucronatum]|uniref:Uncharacterized protein n=1 Tax=Smittium mucronatum TaxID=133383 RepID=A0A1R0H938_9FUNG|nr:hypothetical protein AYI68_g115 [Smittium mucronatum]
MKGLKKYSTDSDLDLEFYSASEQEEISQDPIKTKRKLLPPMWDNFIQPKAKILRINTVDLDEAISVGKLNYNGSNTSV